MKLRDAATGRGDSRWIEARYINIDIVIVIVITVEIVVAIVVIVGILAVEL